MSATLQMIFRNTANRNSTISVADPDSEITALDVEAVMDSIISRNIFDTSGGDLQSKVKAQVVSRTVDVLTDYE
jgi:translation initiation factor RLI1